MCGAQCYGIVGFFAGWDILILGFDSCFSFQYLWPGQKVSCCFVFSVFSELLFLQSPFWKICFHATINILQICIYLLSFVGGMSFFAHILLHSLAKVMLRNSLTIALVILWLMVLSAAIQDQGGQKTKLESIGDINAGSHWSV